MKQECYFTFTLQSVKEKDQYSSLVILLHLMSRATYSCSYSLVHLQTLKKKMRVNHPPYLFKDKVKEKEKDLNLARKLSVCFSLLSFDSGSSPLTNCKHVR